MTMATAVLSSASFSTGEMKNFSVGQESNTTLVDCISYVALHCSITLKGTNSVEFGAMVMACMGCNDLWVEEGVYAWMLC